MLTVIYSSEFLQHDNGGLHPERPERLEAIVAALKAAPFSHEKNVRKVTPRFFRAGL